MRFEIPVTVLEVHLKRTRSPCVMNYSLTPEKLGREDDKNIPCSKHCLYICYTDIFYIVCRSRETKRKGKRGLGISLTLVTTETAEGDRRRLKSQGEGLGQERSYKPRNTTTDNILEDFKLEGNEPFFTWEREVLSIQTGFSSLREGWGR